MKAMILAAGRGKRMGSLTDNVPKPLLQIGNKTLIEWQIQRLARAGILNIVINLGYKGDLIADQLGGGQRYGVRIVYSREPESGLETGGGIIQALPLLENEQFLLVNADIWCDIDFKGFAQSIPQGSMAHLLLVEVPSWREKGDFSLAGHRVIAGDGWLYAGVAMIEPRLFSGAKPGFQALAPFFHTAVAKGAISGEIYRGIWQDVGTPERLRLLQERYKI